MEIRRWASACPWYVIAAAAWLARYATLGNLPWWRAPLWATWFDQSRYVTSTTAFVHGVLTPAAHWYPLGYPLLAVPFALLSPADPFFFLNLLLFLLTCRAFRNVAARMAIGPAGATACFLATTLIDTKLAGAWAHPWTTTLSAALIWTLLDRTLLIAERGGSAPGRGSLAAVGALAAALPLVRPVDALIGATGPAIVFVALLRARRRPFAALVAIAAGGAIVAGLYGALHLAIYGPHATPYMRAAAATGFVWHDLGWKAYILLVHARPWYPDGQAVLERLPWIVPGAAGLVGAAVTGARRERGTARLLLAAIVPASAVMLTYADLQPPGLWRFANIHYFKWCMPAFGAGILVGRRLLRQRRTRPATAAALVALALPLGIRLRPVPVEEGTPARMLMFRGDTARPYDEAYFAPVTIDDAGGRLLNIGDFHQVPDPAGERAIAISRPFARAPRRTDPGDSRAPARQPPFARFGERWSFVGF